LPVVEGIAAGSCLGLSLGIAMGLVGIGEPLKVSVIAKALSFR
jgi:hypothetical protein